MTVGRHLQAAREARGLTRQALAHEVDVPADEIAWWEKNDKLPDAGALPRVAAALSIDPLELRLATGFVDASDLTTLRTRALGAALPLVLPPPAVAEPTDAEPTLSEPTLSEPTLSEPTLSEPTLSEPTLSETMSAEPTMTTSAAPPPGVEGSTPRTQPKVAYASELGTLYAGDCLDIMRALPDRSVDCVFADPPFNLSKAYGDGVEDARSDEEYVRWSRAWLEEAIRLLRPGGALFVYNLPRWSLLLGAWVETRLQFRHWIAIDIKFSLPIAGRLYPSHYGLLYFVKGARARVFGAPRVPLASCRHCGGELRDYGGYRDRMHPAGVNLTDVWYDIPPVRHRRYKNRGANELSIRMLDRVLDIATTEGDVVLDPFAGSGTTAAACELRGRRWIGIELGDVEPMIRRLDDLSTDRDQLDALAADKGRLFTERALALRARHGHSNAGFRGVEATPGDGGVKTTPGDGGVKTTPDEGAAGARTTRTRRRSAE